MPDTTLIGRVTFDTWSHRPTVLEVDGVCPRVYTRSWADAFPRVVLAWGRSACLMLVGRTEVRLRRSRKPRFRQGFRRSPRPEKSLS